MQVHGPFDLISVPSAFREVPRQETPHPHVRLFSAPNYLSLASHDA